MTRLLTIRSTRKYDIKLTLERDPSITREMVEIAKAMAAGEEEEEEDARRAQPTTPTKTLAKSRESADLYSQNWRGDQYVSDGTWNELTVFIAILVGVPLVLVVFAALTDGILWNNGGLNRYA